MHYVGGIAVEYAPQGPPLRSAANYTVTPPAVRGMAETTFQGTLDKAAPPVSARPEVSSSYTVQRGDNLSTIVKDHLQKRGRPTTNADVHAGVRALSNANGISNPNLIHPGQRLDLSTLGGSPAPQAILAPQPAPAAEQIKTRDLPPPLIKATSSLKHAPNEVVAKVAEPEQAAPAPAPEKVQVARAERPAPPLMPRSGPTGEGGPVSHATRLLRKSRDLNETLAAAMQPKSETNSRPVTPWSRTLGGPARLTSGYGMRKDPFTGRPAFHHGLDLAAPRGTAIYPFEGGTVKFNGWKSGYGRVVVVEHDNGLESFYGHTSKNLVPVGTRVERDTIIAEVGSTGRSTGAHLHFEVRHEGKAVNPLPYLQQSHMQTASL